MFDFAWSELALIGVVALVAIGPKDMPVAIKAVAGLVKKARRMAGEFQTHVEDLLKEADLSDVKKDFSALRQFNLRDTMTRAVDPDGSLRATMSEHPFVSSATPMTPLADAQTVGEHATLTVDEQAFTETSFLQQSAGLYGRGTTGAPPHDRPDLQAPAPAFIPPEAVSTEQVRRAAPAFIPPEHAEHGLPEQTD